MRSVLAPVEMSLQQCPLNGTADTALELHCASMCSALGLAPAAGTWEQHREQQAGQPKLTANWELLAADPLRRERVRIAMQV